MNSFKQFLNIAWKDFQILIRDRGLLAVIVAMPLLFGLILSTAYSGMFTDESNTGITIPVMVVNEDDGPFSQTIIDNLQQVDVLKITEVAADTGNQAANEAILDGTQTAALIIPVDFSSSIQDYSGANLTLIVDPQKKELTDILTGVLDYALTPVVIEGEIRYGVHAVLESGGFSANHSEEKTAATEAQTLGVVMTRLQTLMSKPQIMINMISTARNANQPVNFFNMLMPGFTVMFSFFLVGSVGESIFREKDEGTYRRLLAGPITPGAIIAGKMLAFSSIILLQVAILFGVSAGFFSMDLGSNPLGMILITVCLSLVVTSLGLMIAALSKSGKQADLISTLLAFVLAGLGGCIQFGLTPLFLQENFIARFSRFIPQGQALWGYYKLINQNAGLKDILPQAGILLGMALVFFIIARWRLKWDSQ